MSQADQSSHELQRDPRWEVFPALRTLEDFDQLINHQLSLRPEVDEAVRKHFKAVQEAVRFSYFQYELLEVAEDRAYTGLEFALRRLWRKRNGVDLDIAAEDDETDEPFYLSGLVKWAEKVGLFNDVSETPAGTSGLEIIQWLSEKQRNKKTVHRDRWSRHGFMAITFISKITEIINQIYVDLEADS